MCHQSTSLVARHLEAAGIPTVVMGNALDIVVEAAAPRFLFLDTPLGNPCGPPGDAETQRSLVDMALTMLETVTLPATTVRAPIVWPDDDWRANYMHVGDDNREELRRLGEARRAKQSAKS